MRSAFSAESCAKLRISVATTTKPLPNSPARAASIEPFTASILVWMDTVAIASTILSIRRDNNSKSVTRLMLSCVLDIELPIPLINESTNFLLVVNESWISRTASKLLVPRSCAISKPFWICVNAETDSSVADACERAPSRIWLIASIICEPERLISCTAEDNSSAEEATSSALLATSVEVFKSSASSDKLCASCSHSESARACSSMVLLVSSAAADCSSAAAAMASEPISACCDAVTDCCAPVAISRIPLTTSILITRIFSSCSVIRRPFSTSTSTVFAEVLIPSAITFTSPWICATNSWICFALFSDVSANVRTSSATTAKPLPCWPARAASMAAFNANKFVWSAIRATAFTMSPMFAAWFSSSMTISTDKAWRLAACPTFLIKSLISVLTRAIKL